MTKKGTGRGVVDDRYKGWKDLCADIDSGGVRSTDGGLGWSAPEVWLDGGEGDKNGIGDPCIVQDDKGRVWIQGLAAHFGGGPALKASKAGFAPNVTGQWEMTYSDNDGKSWAKNNLNFTEQVKQEAWTLHLAGPGSGITMKDGTIIIPAQFWQNGAKPRSQSTICYSKDKGKSWKMGQGVGRDTSECQVVQLKDGSLMLNCRDEGASRKRAVYITKDMGETWEEHPTHLKDLPEPTCQASIIRFRSKKHGDLLLFANPNSGNRGRRDRITIRVSKDEGMSWSKGYEIERRVGGGYTSMAQIDEDTVGILYESCYGRALKEPRYDGISFQRIPLATILQAE